MKLGIIGTGRIAKRFVPEALIAGGIDVTAAYNPHEGSAERFLREIGSSIGIAVNEKPRSYRNITPLTDLEELWSCTDAVYIASPHETHVHYIMEALSRGKHVLCEKPMALKAEEAGTCLKLADERALVLMEGIKTAWCPGYRKLVETAKSGIIGDIRHIEACFTKLEDKGKRELIDIKYGGSFTELGSYVMLPIIDIFGAGYEDIRFSEIDNELDIDIFTRADFTYRDGLATATCGLGVKKEGSLLISGALGYIKAEAPWWKTRVFEINFEDPAKSVRYEEPFEGEGLRYEIREFLRRIKTGSGIKITGHENKTAGYPSCADNPGENRCPEKEKERSLIMAEVIERFMSIRRR
ncbi:MAG: Gfo/Idh/MocA family oxidoreductase [Lachnospiraceae bacterium]|nr:Gfo/Idh/MocA family oxidoreductase [Lachnospiraceae bacterium]